MNRLSHENQADILEDMMERKSLRGLSRTARGNSKTRRKGVSINTVLKLLEDAGDTAIEFLDARMRNLPCRYVEADEVYCLVKINARTRLRRKVNDPTLGGIWLWVAIDAVSKLIVGWHIGGRFTDDAKIFMKGLAARFAGRIQLTTDSLSSYLEAVPEAFDDIDYVTVKKRSAEEERQRIKAEAEGKPYRPRRRKLSDPPLEREPPIHRLGEPDDEWATTNHIEAFFTQLRQDLARMTRRATTISKKIENLERAFALYAFHHNFVKVHSSLKGQTPAVAAGIDDSSWDWVDFTTLIDEFWKIRRERKKASSVLPPEDTTAIPLPAPIATEGPFRVFHALNHKTAKVHLSTCAHLRTKPGREGVKGLGNKLYCESLSEALTLAERLTPGRVTECRVCLGNYNSKDYLGPK